MHDFLRASPATGGLPDQAHFRRMLRWMAVWPVAVAVLPGTGVLLLTGMLPEAGGKGAALRHGLISLGVCSAVIGAVLAVWLREVRRMLIRAYQNSLNAWRRQVEESQVLLNSIGDAVLAANPSGKVLFLNPVAEKLTGWLSEEARGRPLGEVFVIFNEQTGQPAEDPVAKVLRERRVVELANHTVIRARDGTERPIEDSAAPILGSHGEMRGVILVFHDVTEKYERRRRLEESERQFRVVFNQQFQFMALLSPEGRVREINDLPLTVAGTTREETQGRLFWETPWWRDMPECQAAWPARLEEAARAPGPVLSRGAFRTAAGEVRQADCALTAVKNEAGGVELFIVQASDVTEREQATRAMNETRRRLQFLHDLSEATRALADPLTVMETVARTLGEHLKVSRCAWAEVREDGERFTVLHDWTDGSASTAGDYELSLFGPRTLMKMRKGRTLVISDVKAELTPQEGGEMFRSTGIQALICCPLLKDGHLRAMMAVHMTAPRRWNAEEVALVEDVTERSWAYIERVRSETALAQNEERLRLAGRATDDAIWDWDLKTQRVLWNEAIQRLTGYGPEEIGPDVSWWKGHIHEDDRRRVLEDIHKVIDGEDSRWEAEYRFLRRDGTHAWVLDRAHMLRDASGKAVRMIGAMLDLTERRRAQEAIREGSERLKLAFDAAAMGLWDFFTLTGELRWDARCRELFGLPEDAEVTYDVFLAGLHPEDRAPIDSIVQHILQGGAEAYDVEYRTVGLEDGGQERWLHCTGRTFKNEEGKIHRFVGIVRDITTVRRTAEELRRARDQAEAGLRARDTFLASLSHELRTPLTPVLMTAAALREDPRLPEDVRSQLGMIQRNIELESRLIDDLLDLTLISRRRFSLQPQPCEMHSLVGLAMEFVREEAKSKNQTLKLELHATQTALHADPARLQQVLWNLLRNAIKFTPEHGCIRIRTRDGAKGCLRLEISDNGIGISPEALERIFEPFEQGALLGNHRYGGMGLGLSIARTIVDMHGGVITAVSSGEGTGSTFTVELPRAEPPADGAACSEEPHAAPPDHETPSPAPPPSGTAAPARRLRLLVVEDHAATLMTLRRLLEREGHTVATADSVSAALQTVQQTAAEGRGFDLVISDLGLPDGTGFELMSRLRDEYGLRGIALSGYGLEEDLRLSRSAGFVRHLIKPVKISQIREALEEAC